MRRCDDSELGRGEEWIFQIDPETGRGGWHIQRYPLPAPFLGLWEIATGRLSRNDWIFGITACRAHAVIGRQLRLPHGD